MILNIKNIIVDNRIRKDFGDVESLAAGIEKYGLLHPLVVTPAGDDKYNLVSGERRLRAHLLLGRLEIECTLREDLDELSSKEIELEENINRHQLSWPEQCAAVKQLDDIKRRLYGDSQHGSEYGEGWGLEDTAEQLGASIGRVSQDIQLAKDLEAHPELAIKAMGLPKHAAQKMMKNFKEAERLRHSVANKDIIIDIDLRPGDCSELVDELKDGSIDLWLTDPPFALDKISAVAKAGSYNRNTTNVGVEKTLQKVYDKLIPTMYKKMREGAHFYMFHGPGWYCRLVHMMRTNGFIVDDIPLIWNKQRTSVMAKDMHYMSSYEPILFGYKPPVKNILKKPMKNVFSIPAIHPQHRVHPLQRPEELLSIFIENSTNVGETVLDTFSGSGSTLVAAHRLQRKAIGFELDERNYLTSKEWFLKEFDDESRSV